MKKIKKFKISLRKREVLRNLKLISEIKEITPQLEEIISKEIEKSIEYIHPASVFETFSIDELNKKFGLKFEQQYPAISIIVVTIGNEIEKIIEELKSRGEILHSQIVHSIGIEACESSKNFIYKIIDEEAKEEECILLAPEKQNEENSKNIIRNFDVKRIGVFIDDKNTIQPIYTDVSIVKWQTRTKKQS
ncbi:MAG: hypothetical protein ACK4JE_05950 [Endomicrobiia bacterium]